MRIFLDGDSLPKKIRTFLFFRANELRIKTFFVANKKIDFDETIFFSLLLVEKTRSSADNFILENANEKDLVVTRDIPLAYSLCKKNIAVINDRGFVYTKESAEQKLRDRNFNFALSKIGFTSEKKSHYSEKEFEKFRTSFEKKITTLIQAETQNISR